MPTGRVPDPRHAAGGRVTSGDKPRNYRQGFELASDGALLIVLLLGAVVLVVAERSVPLATALAISTLLAFLAWWLQRHKDMSRANAFRLLGLWCLALLVGAGVWGVFTSLVRW